MYPATLLMTDVFKPQKRSAIMSHIRSKDTSPELAVRKTLNNLEFKFRLHVFDLPGKPDFANKKEKTAIFVNGCFWHQHKNCKRNSTPKTNIEYWLPKLAKNVAKQKSDFRILRRNEWKVIVIWECETKDLESLEKKVKKELWPN